MEENFKALEKYNFWSNNLPQLGFLRESYLKKIFKYIDNKLVKVLVGQRRSGKSYILRQIANELIKKGVDPKNIFYINKEFINFDFLNHYQDLEDLFNFYKSKLNPLGKIYLFIDEVQNIAEWEKFVNSYAQDYTENIEIFISGSNSNLLSGELATLLSGRYVSFEIFPFSYEEYIGITQQIINKQSYIAYMESGGLPELFVLPTNETKRHYVSSIKDTVLLKDIIQRYAIKDAKLLEDIFIYLVNNASNLMSVNNIANFLKSNGRKTTFDTVANYINYIEETYIIHKVLRYDIKGKETLLGNGKYYCNDLAYKNYLYSGFGYGIGYLLENLIYLELRRNGFEVYIGVIPNKEVDFVAKKDDKILYIQSSYLLFNEETSIREYSALEAIKDNYDKIVVTLDDIAIPQHQGIKHLQAWNLPNYLKNW